MLPVSRAIFSGVAPFAPRLVHGVGLLALVSRGTVQQLGNRGSNQLDVADLLRSNALEEVLVGLRRRVAAEIHALEQVLHHGAHFAELPAKALLEGVRCGGVRLIGGDFIDQELGVQVHGAVSSLLL